MAVNDKCGWSDLVSHGRFVWSASLILSLGHGACLADEPGQDLAPTVRQLDNTAPERVLFVGNSYLYYNDSLHNHVARIAAEIGARDRAEYQYKSATIGWSEAVAP